MFTILIRKNALFYNFEDILGYDGRIDSVATKILQKIEKEKAESESKSHWEKTLLDFVKHETQLLDVKAYSDLCHLFDDRNLSAQDIAT